MDRLGNSVLAFNSGGSCTGGPPHSVGHNIADDTSCGLSGPGDRQAIDPQLGPVADNGGRTFTALPASTSPLLDAADPVSCPPFDERGVRRPQGPGCDIGAVEREFVALRIARLHVTSRGLHRGAVLSTAPLVSADERRGRRSCA